MEGSKTRAAFIRHQLVTSPMTQPTARQMSGETALKKKHKQKWGLFARPKGKCCFCSVPMLLAFHHIKDPPKNLATLEHADDRFSDERGTHNGEYRNSLCCWQCNFDRGQASQASQALVELHRRAGNGAFSDLEQRFSDRAQPEKR
jgi:hypothetical protein